jgi:hypothetical protein
MASAQMCNRIEREENENKQKKKISNLRPQKPIKVHAFGPGSNQEARVSRLYTSP